MMIRSSYIPNHFGRLIQSLVEVLQPNLYMRLEFWMDTVLFILHVD